MAASRSRKLRMLKEIGMYFAELGRIPARSEYSKLKERPKFLTVKEVDRILGSWTLMLMMLEKEQKELWEIINRVPEPPVVKAKPAKIAVSERKDGKDI